MGTIGPLAHDYITDRRRRDEITARTAANIRCHLGDFDDSFGNRPLDQLGPRAVERWIEHMVANEVAPATQALRLSSLRCFARWCVLHGHVPRDWTIAAPKVRRPRQVPRDMDNDHFDAVLGHARDTRERLIVWLMFGCGLRCVEVSRMNVDDYDPRSRMLFVTGKGGHQRHVPTVPPVDQAITAYLVEVGHTTGALVRVADGARRLGQARISGLVGRMVRDAGIKTRNYDGRSAHGLRSAGASDLYAACQDPQVVQEFLGHANLATTSVYLRRAKLERVRDAQQARQV